MRFNFYTCLRILMLSCIGFGKPINVVKSSFIEKPTNFFRVCSRNASKSFCLTFGTHGNSFIRKVDAGSTLDASLANDVVDSDELSDGADEIIVEASSSFPLADPSSLTASESKADCFVKLY